MPTDRPDDPRPGADEAQAGDPDQGFIRELSQFFIVPSLIVLLCVGVFLMFGLLTSENRDARDFLQEVRSGRETDRWQAAFEMSRAISRQPAGSSDPRLVEEIIAAIRKEGASDPRVRKYLVIALEHLGSHEADGVLVELLSDSDLDVRLHAARAVGVIGEVTGSTDPLIALLQDDDAGIRKVAIYALGRSGDRSAIPALTPRLEDAREEIRWNAALALAVLGDGSGREVLATMLDRDHLDRVPEITEEQKTNALVNGVQAVYLLRDPELIEQVRELSRSDPNLEVRKIALQALAAIEKS